MTSPQRAVISSLSAVALNDVLTFMDDNLGRDLRLQELAAVSGLGISRFKTLFREATGVSAYQYVIRRRVERAAELLRTGNLPITRIALDTGFCHQSHLAAHMRRRLGVTPSALRKSAQRSNLNVERLRRSANESLSAANAEL